LRPVASPDPSASNETAADLSALERQGGYLFSTRDLIEEISFRLTRVTRIFQKSVFTETTPNARTGCRARRFVARPRVRPRAACFFRFETSQGEQSDAVSKGPKRQSSRAPARVAQSDNHPHASFAGGSRGGDRAQGDSVGGGRRYGRHSPMHGSARASAKG
jgi:hypothetical protein